MKKNNAFTIVGKVVVFIIIAIVALPYVLDSLFHKQFNPPKDIIYATEIEDDDIIRTRKMAIVFSDEIMKVYSYETDPFGGMRGFRIDFKYRGDSCYHLVGPVYIKPKPSILFWQNYELFNRYTLDKAVVSVLPKGIRTLNFPEVNGIYKDSVETVNIDIRTKSIKFEDIVLTVPSENDTTDYELIYFDRDSEELTV